MVDSVANMLLETLRDVLIEEVKFLSGVSDEVKKVERDLRTIHGLLMKADRNRSESPTLKVCIDELKELAFKAENVLETYAVDVESKKEGKSLKKKLQRFIGILCECYSVHHVGNEIGDIRSRLTDLTGKLSSISRSGDGSSNSADEEQRRLSRLRYAHEVEQHFVGMEKDIERLVSMVLKDDEPRHISICGMGGLGKTTLARKIYHHQNVRGRFDGRAWVCVTQQFQAHTILREILKQVDNCRGHEINTMGLSELVPGLYSVLEQRKCVIVIDDIWESPHWEILKPAFPMNCKVILTTRNENIITTHGECRLHKLDFLTEDEGWELLGKIALPSSDVAGVLESKSKQFEDIGRQIVHKCGRLPLAISVIGGILREKSQILGEWEKVSAHIDSNLRGGVGIGNDRRAKLVLNLSYDVLPYYIKPCFLYLACFPEDKEIDKEELYLLWIAEGLISLDEKGKNDSLGDVAERYLTELAFRCMIQVEKKAYDKTLDKFTTCRLHDLMRDLCSSKAEEEKFLKRIDLSKHQHDITSSIIGRDFIHRIAINIDNDDATLCQKTCVQELEGLRSILVHCKNRRIHFENIVNLENSKHLRILVLDRLEFEGGKLPSTIGKLIHLRYLSLRYCNVEELPQHVCDLPYLIILDLRVKYGSIIKLPNHIWKIKRLRHLFLYEKIQVIGGDKLRLDGLNELETLVSINSKSVCIADIITLTNLRKLFVTIEEDVDSLSKIVEYMSNDGCQLLESRLYVERCDLSRNTVKKVLMSSSLSHLDIRNCEIGSGFPCYEQGMCHNLVLLLIEDSKIGVDMLEQFGKYPILQSLWLEAEEEEQQQQQQQQQQEVVETEMRFRVNSFPQLKRLLIRGLLNLEKWEVEIGAMPKLEELWLYDCINLEKLPGELRFIITLRNLQTLNMSEELKSRMRRGGQDYDDFSHIPEISID